jgi:hypothetical protein
MNAERLILELFRTSAKYRDRPAASDIALCVAAYAGIGRHIVGDGVRQGSCDISRNQPCGIGRFGRRT